VSCSRCLVYHHSYGLIALSDGQRRDILRSGGDAFLVALTVRVGAMIVEGSFAIPEELPQPAAKDRLMKADLLTKTWSRNLLDDVPTQDRDLLFRGMVLAL